MRESEIEAHLVKRVKAEGGEVRKVQWIGRRGAPDRLVLLPLRVFDWGDMGERPYPASRRPFGSSSRHRAKRRSRTRKENTSASGRWANGSK